MIIKTNLLLLLLTVFFLNTVLIAQPKLEKNIKGLNLGITTPIGPSIFNELCLSTNISLRAELGLNYSYKFISHHLTPIFTFQPRWYYSLKRRDKKSKNISGNSASFLTLSTYYLPTSKSLLDKNVQVESTTLLIPVWGLRRKLGKKFSFEFLMGYGGFIRMFPKWNNADKETVILGVNFGYNFYKK